MTIDTHTQTSTQAVNGKRHRGGLVRCCGKTVGIWPDTTPRRCKRPAKNGYYTCERHIQQDPLPFEPHRFISVSSSESAPCSVSAYGAIKVVHQHHFKAKPHGVSPKKDEPKHVSADEGKPVLGTDFLAGVITALLSTATEGEVKNVVAGEAAKIWSAWETPQERVAYCAGYLVGVKRHELADLAIKMAKREGVMEK